MLGRLVPLAIVGLLALGGCMQAPSGSGGTGRNTTGNITLTGALPMTITAFTDDSATIGRPGYVRPCCFCYGKVHRGHPPYHGLDITAAFGAGTGYTPGEQVEVAITARSTIDGQIYTGPGTYAIDWVHGSGGSGSMPEANAVDIENSGGIPVANMWKGTITVSRDERRASFNGIYTHGLVTVAEGWNDSGTISGVVSCVT
jgi:hypothetical protein